MLYRVPLPTTLWVVPTHLSSRHNVATVTLRIATTLSMYLEAADKVSINKQTNATISEWRLCLFSAFVSLLHALRSSQFRSYDSKAKPPLPLPS